MKAVPYLRVSTDNKGQDPARQLVTIQPWANTYNVELLTPIVDEGTSATHFPDPFRRPKFLEAVQAAKLNKANAIIVEIPDRFTRKGSRLHGYYKTKLELEHKLKLWCADRTMENQDSNMGELMEAVQASSAREKADTLSRRVREAFARDKARGKKWGQPKKTITAIEKDLASKLREEGYGWDAIAARINETRGAHLIATPEVKRRKSISGATVRRAFHPRNPTEPPAPSERSVPGVSA